MKKLFAFACLIALSCTLLAARKMSTQELIQQLKTSSKAGDRAEAAEELGTRGEPLGLDSLVEATADTSEKVQLAAVESIGKISDPRQVSSLSTAVRQSKGKAQHEAIHLLVEHYIPNAEKGALKELEASVEKLFSPPHPIVVEPWIQVDQEAIDAIISALDNQNSENRVQAAATLGILRAQPAIPRIAYYLQSPSQQMVRTCIRSIGYIGQPEAGSYLIPLLKSKDDDIVMDAARVLGQFKYKPAVAELTHLLDYTNKQEYRRVALQAISRIADPSSEKEMQKYYTSNDALLRQYSIEGFGRMGLKGYTEPLEREALRGGSKQIKLALSFSLYALGRRAHLDPLVRGLQDGEVRNQVREYFVELGSPAIPDLAAYLKPADKDLRLRIVRMLGDMHKPEAIPYLEPYIKDQSVDVAQEATDAIRKLRKMQDATKLTAESLRTQS